uniref:2-oxoadipate dehydrogenase complex component E1 n=1 Tax=Phallusia mammillata TaxID=59560 RepID=A0A6F9DB48_9ASCI|nr:probable 2-oxoglutarate dehydrogenase E1 component DHKTD1, mitochondrial [Phallusia mammillata]
MSIFNLVLSGASRNSCRIFRSSVISQRFYRYKQDVYGYKNSANVVIQENESPGSKQELTYAAHKLKEAYESHGHKLATIYPLKNITHLNTEELDPAYHGLNLQDKVLLQGDLSVENLVKKLQNTFCGNSSVEASMIDNVEERSWVLEKFAELHKTEISKDDKQNICSMLVKSEVLDNFLATKFPTLKRYACEGAESMLSFVHYMLRYLSSQGAEQVVFGMPHRGRNNLLHGELNYPAQVMFRKMKGLREFPEEAMSIAVGDVLSHLDVSTDVKIEDRSLHVTLVQNPSHLEAQNAVVAGKCRGRQQTLGDGDFSTESDTKRGEKVVCFTIHGDAAFAGQGVVMEALNMSRLPHFDVGGTIHLIVNNLLGFTTPPHHGRSTPYSSDIGKMIGCPVIHVNGDSPEDVVKAAQLATEYRHKFRKDIIVDMLCYRRWGHNEMDDPTFTQPLTYKMVENRKSVPQLYVDKLMADDVITNDIIEKWKSEESEHLNGELKGCESVEPDPNYLQSGSSWQNMMIPRTDSISQWDTGCSAALLRYVGAKSVEIPEWFNIHEHLLKTHVTSRLDKLRANGDIDWSLAEAFAFGSLMHQNFDVRLCGQDVGRGTFSHRHDFLVDQVDGTVIIPLNHMHENQKGHLEIVNSLLSEEAVLGFEYGMSIENPNRLIVWEAQFGDFFNGAQIVIDTMVTSGEAKWMYQSGLVMLLPHGYDGAGPEHSSCRIERFLQCTNSSETHVDGDGVNMSVCHPTTSAQYFHLLRRQMLRNFRKPLIVASPKILLRFPPAMSPMKDFEEGTTFQPVIGDDRAPKSATNIIFCSGKHYYALEKERAQRKRDDTAILRLEELCPFPTSAIQRELAKYPSVKYFVWSQEEPRNMGPWGFVAPRFENLLGIQPKFAGRPCLPAPAVGIGQIHNEQIQNLMQDTFS